MNLCLSTLACPDWELTQIIHAAHAAGLNGIDFRGIGPQIDITQLDAFNEKLRDTLALLRENDLSMPCLNTSVTLVCPDPQAWQRSLDECARYAFLAQRTGTRWIRIFGGKVPPAMERAQARTLAQRHLRQLIKICKTHDCRPILETHDDWATSARVMELLDGFSPKDVSVLWDIEHPFRQGEPIGQTATALRPWIQHVHVKDSIRMDGRSVPKLLGEGELPLADAYHALRSIDYDGWFSLETEKRWHKDGPAPEVSVPQFAKFMRALEAGK